MGPSKGSSSNGMYTANDGFRITIHYAHGDTVFNLDSLEQTTSDPIIPISGNVTVKEVMDELNHRAPWPETERHWLQFRGLRQTGLGRYRTSNGWRVVFENPGRSWCDGSQTLADIGCTAERNKFTLGP